MGVPVPDLMELMSREEALLPELEPYMRQGPMGPMLHHPLAIEIMVPPGRCGLINYRHRMKSERVAKLLEERNFQSYIGLHERPYRMDALRRAIDDYAFAAEPDFWEAVLWVWSDSENIWENLEEWQEVWAESGSAIPALEADDRAAYEALPDEVEIWRGIDASVGNPEGLSWSLSREKAEWFANRWKPADPAVYRAGVRKADILAVLLGRGEQEVVVFPESLMEVERV